MERKELGADIGGGRSGLMKGDVLVWKGTEEERMGRE